MNNYKSEASDSSATELLEYPTRHDDHAPLIQKEESDTQPDPPNHFKTSLLCVISLTLGGIQTIPLAILIPESLNLGLSTQQAFLILAAWATSSLLALLIQPVMNRLNDFLYLSLTGLVSSAGFCSFYYSVTVPHYYLYLAVLAQFASGAALFLIKNKTAVGITNHLQGNVSKSSTLWEAFFSGGEAIGAYIGSWLDAKIGFSLSMTVAGITLLVAVSILACCYPRNNRRTEESDETSTRDIYLLYVSRDLLVYCWVPMICIGAVTVYTEGILTEFYLEEFSKSLQFGGVIIGVSGIVYCISAAFIGMLREKWPVLTIVGLVSGLFGCGVVLLFIGPIICPPGGNKLVLSILAANLLQLCSCAIQLNSLTLAAGKLSKVLDSEQAMSVSLNAVNVAYNLGSMVGPVIGGSLLTRFHFKEVFAIGTPFCILSALVVGVYHL